MTREEAKKIVYELSPELLGQTSEDRKIIREIVNEFKIEGVNLRGNCPNCWQDAVLVLRNFFEVDKEEDKTEISKKWRFVGKTAMRWKGHLIDATTPDEVIDKFVKYHPKFFERIEKEEEK